LETLPKPINYSGKMPPISYGGTYTLERVLGTVPVEPDGSAFMELPALRPLFFVALDKNNNSVKRMHSFLTVMPGETTSCIGCHEQRTQTPSNLMSFAAAALKRPAHKITPIEGIPDVFDFPRDIQPILDRHCIKCHDYDQRAGQIILTGDHGPIYSHSYFTLTALQYVSDGRDRMRTNMPPKTVGTSASKLMKLIDGSHFDAKLSVLEQDYIRYWIESAASYPGTYAALGTGMIGGFHQIAPGVVREGRLRVIGKNFSYQSPLSVVFILSRFIPPVDSLDHQSLIAIFHLLDLAVGVLNGGRIPIRIVGMSVDVTRWIGQDRQTLKAGFVGELGDCTQISNGLIRQCAFAPILKAALFFPRPVDP